MKDQSYQLDESGAATLKKWGDIDKIAEEAAREIDRTCVAFAVDEMQPIIKSAIEKATERVTKERDAWKRVANWDTSQGGQDMSEPRKGSPALYAASPRGDQGAERILAKRLREIWDARPIGYIPTPMELDFMNALTISEQSHRPNPAAADAEKHTPMYCKVKDCPVCAAWPKPPKPTASTHAQEWVAKHLPPKYAATWAVLEGERIIAEGLTKRVAKKIADAHNAAIADLNQKRNWALKQWDLCKDAYDAAMRQPQDTELRKIVETVVLRTAQADCPAKLNVETAMREFDQMLSQARQEKEKKK